MVEKIAWLTAELTAGVDKFIAERDLPPNPRMSRDEALQVIVRDWLQSQGHVALPDGETVAPVSEASELPDA